MTDFVTKSVIESVTESETKLVTQFEDEFVTESVTIFMVQVVMDFEILNPLRNQSLILFSNFQFLI